MKKFNKTKLIKIMIDIVIIVVIFLSLFSVILTRQATDLDEMWNYNTARCIANCLVPYKDISMITTPFLPFITAFILKITYNGLITSRVLAAILGTAILFITYKIVNLLFIRLIQIKENKILINNREEKNKIKNVDSKIKVPIEEKIENEKIEDENVTNEKINLRKELIIRAVSFIIIAFLELIYLDYFAIDYNFAILLIAVIMIYKELKNINFKERKKNNNYLDTKIEENELSIKTSNKTQNCIENKTENSIENKTQNERKNIFYNSEIGILAGIAICTKQTIGIAIFVFSIILPLLLIESNHNKKTAYKSILFRLIGAIIPILILLIYLLTNNALNDFVNYAIEGVKEFTNKIKYTALFSNENALIRILSILMPIIFITSCILQVRQRKNNKEDEYLETLIIYSIPLLIIVYPISDEIHFLLSIYIMLIITIYLIAKILLIINKKIKQNKKNYVYLSLLVFCLLSIIYNLANISIKNIKKYKTNTKINYSVENLKYVEIPDYLLERICDIDDFIIEKDNENKKVYIADSEATIYDLTLNRYCKNYDMFLKGNIGKDGENTIIKQIEESTDTYYLVKKDSIRLNWQTPTKVVDYIKNSLEKVGDVSVYNIYYKK